MNPGGQSSYSYRSVRGQRTLPEHGYPRPQLRRAEWISLNGKWDFAIDAEGRWTSPQEVVWRDTIEVPYSPETQESGVAQTGFFQACWYHRRLEPLRRLPGKRWILHFGAVDYAAIVWLNGEVIARHEGGYTPFQIDITREVGSGPLELVVRAEDDPHDLAKPRGKQYWYPHPQGIWYPRTTGIWQTVWLEPVPETAIGSVQWTPRLGRWELGLTARLDGAHRDDLRMRVRLSAAGKILMEDTSRILAGEVRRGIMLPDPGVDDERRQLLLWSPERPNLIRAELALIADDGTMIDRVESYAGMRSVGIDCNRLLLNGRPYPLRFVLDQGYWPATGMTPPDDESVRRDILLTKMMGFNGVRKHQKIEDPRYAYWADRLGLLVWAEMPAAHKFSPTAIQRFTRECMDVIARDYSHPCIVAWVPFNESWGLPNLAEVEEQRHYALSVYHLTKALDPSRPVVGNDGWESIETDIVGIHDYCQDPVRLGARYRGPDVLARILSERPSGRLVSLNGKELGTRPVMLTEFGGVAFSSDPGTWGYSRSETAEDFRDAFNSLVTAAGGTESLAGFCYTQFADTYQETNGLLRADRTPKLPLEQIRRAVLGQGRGAPI